MGWEPNLRRTLRMRINLFSGIKSAYYAEQQEI